MLCHSSLLMNIVRLCTKCYQYFDWNSDCLYAAFDVHILIKIDIECSPEETENVQIVLSSVT